MLCCHFKKILNVIVLGERGENCYLVEEGEVEVVLEVQQTKQIIVVFVCVFIRIFFQG